MYLLFLVIAEEKNVRAFSSPLIALDLINTLAKKGRKVLLRPDTEGMGQRERLQATWNPSCESAAYLRGVGSFPWSLRIAR